MFQPAALFRVLALFVLCIGFEPMAVAHERGDQQPDDFMLADAGSVGEAVDAISARLEGQGLSIAAIIDHQAGAASVGQELRPTTLIIFSDPRTESRLIRRAQQAAIDLPQKILVWEDAAGEIRLAYNASGYVADRHAIRKLDPLLRRIDKTLGQFGPLDDGVVTVASMQSVEGTVASLQAALLDAGFRLPLVVDFSAQTGGKHLPPTQLIVAGNPNVGTQLMQNQQSTGLDLPQKFLVFEDRNGQVQISYNDPRFLARRHNIQGLDALLANIAAALSRFAAAGANL